MHIGIDIGGSHTKIVGLNLSDKPELVFKNTFPTESDYSKGLESILISLNLYLKDIESIGIGIAGVVEQGSGKLLFSPNLPGWSGYSLVTDLRSRLPMPIKIINDTVAAARGEALFGDHSHEDFLYLNWGTGIGGAFVSHKSDDSKHLIFSSEPGHQILDPGGPLCHCGQRGCLEVYCGGNYFIERYHYSAAELPATEWRPVLTKLSQGLINFLVNHPPVPLVILGGGISLNHPTQFSALAQLLTSQLHIYPTPKLALSQLGEMAGAYGAATLNT